MKRTNSKQQLELLPPLTLLLLLILTQKAQCLSLSTAAVAQPCNATADHCLPAEVEELLMESETSRRVLQEMKTISYQGLNPKPFCDKKNYGSCIGEESKNYNKRPCNHANTCGRAVP